MKKFYLFLLLMLMTPIIFAQDSVMDSGGENNPVLVNTGTEMLLVPCGQTTTNTALENGWFTNAGSNQQIAADFTVPAFNDFTLETIVINIWTQGGSPINPVDFYFHADATGPGAQLASAVGQVPTSQVFIGSNFGYDINEYTFDLTGSGIVLSAGALETSFWLRMETSNLAGSNVAWDTFSAATAGNVNGTDTYVSLDTGGSWGPITGWEQAFSISGDCACPAGNVPPMITCPMDVTTTAGGGLCGAVVAFPDALGTDVDGNLVSVTQTGGLPSGSEFPVGINTIEYTATDSCGETAVCTFTITVTDDEDPTLTCPADITVSNDAGVCEAFVTVPAPTIMDNCPVILASDVMFMGPVTEFVDDGNGELDDTPTTVTGLTMAVPGNDVEISFETNGDFGFSSECFVLNGPDGSEIFNECDLGSDCVTANRTFTVAEATWNNWITTFGNDLTFTLLADSSVDLFCDDTYQLSIVTGTPTGVLTNDYNGTADASDTYPVGTTAVTFTYTDNGGNSGSCTMNITVEDTEAPVVMCEGDAQTLDIIQNGSFETGDFTGWTAIDNPNPFVPWGVYPDNDGGGFFTPALPTDGALLAGNGFDGESGEAVIYQDVSIDAGAVSAMLSWDENIDYDLASFCTGCQDRIYEVQVRDLSDNVLETLVQIIATAGNIDSDNTWVSQTADLAAYAGQDVRIAFWQNIPDNFSGPAKFALDNVRLNVETLSSAPLVVELDANGMATVNAADLVSVTDNCGSFTVELNGVTTTMGSLYAMEAGFTGTTTDNIARYGYDSATDDITLEDNPYASTTTGGNYSLAVNPVSGMGYLLADSPGTGNRALFEYDLATGTLGTEIGDVVSAGGAANPNAMTFGTDGTLYISFGTGDINTFDVGTATSTAFATAPQNGGGIGLTYDSDAG
nr:HYR domain-containing protein [Flavobacteriaceae bacterium]